MTNLRSKLIRIAHTNPELRAEILPLLKGAAEDTKSLDDAGVRPDHPQFGDTAWEWKTSTLASLDKFAKMAEKVGKSNLSLQDKVKAKKYASDAYKARGVIAKIFAIEDNHKTSSADVEAAAKAPAKLKGKKLEAAVTKAYYKHFAGVQIDIWDIGKISDLGQEAYEGGATIEEAEKALDEAMAKAVPIYRKN